MHHRILGFALLAPALAAAGAAPAPNPVDCPARNAVVAERFTSADCPQCWSAPPTAAVPGAAPAWQFDWITPTPNGVEAPLSAAALGESSERAARAGKPAPVEQQALNSAGRLAPPRGSGLVVSVGPAWHGYFGVQVDLSGPVPPGASLWLALVEQLPAGSDGSPQARELVRSVAGPLPLDAMRPAPGSKRPRIAHLRAMRWPDSAQPERLQARAWLEAADGAMLAVASSRCALK